MSLHPAPQVNNSFYMWLTLVVVVVVVCLSMKLFCAPSFTFVFAPDPTCDTLDNYGAIFLWTQWDLWPKRKSPETSFWDSEIDLEAMVYSGIANSV